MTKRAVLLLPGEISLSPIIPIITPETDYIIAVDGGVDKAAPLQVEPNLWIGDFDSCTEGDIVKFSYLLREKYPQEKSEVDTELALNKAQELGITEVLMIGGMGGRLDHQAALLMLPFQYDNFTFTYTNGSVWMYNIPNNQSLTIKTIPGNIISIIPLENLKGVSIKDTKWELTNVDLEVGRGLSISNQAKSETATVFCKEGKAWLYYQS